MKSIMIFEFNTQSIFKYINFLSFEAKNEMIKLIKYFMNRVILYTQTD